VGVEGHGENELTLHAAAAELGVHYMTAYRYVRLGLLSAAKVGGTWRVTREDLDTFRSVGTSAVGAVGRNGRSRVPWAERLEQRLVAGDARGSWGVVESALASGMDLDAVYLDVMSPALVTIGHRWAEGELDIAVEHRASGIVMRMLGRLGPRFSRRGRSRGTVILGAPPGEQHVIPISMLADLARQAGFEVADLGADVPVASFAHSVRSTPDLVAVGIGVSTGGHLDAAAAVCAAVRGEVGSEVLVLLGGRAVEGDDHARALGADQSALDGRAALAAIEEHARNGERDAS
jgi:MerR family transcriptional regulator, light-induced transcriptional regulator